MNVLAKIVIPRTNVTMGYINNELEELAREEFFRLKKVLDIKRRMYGDKKKDSKKEGDTTCPTCKIDCIEPKVSWKNEIEETQSLKPSIAKATSDEYLIDDINKLIKQVTNIVTKTKSLDKKGAVNTTYEEFMKSAEELKTRLGTKLESDEQTHIHDNESSCTCEDDEFCGKSLPEDIDLEKLCDNCTEKYFVKSNLITEDKEAQTDSTEEERMEPRVIKTSSDVKSTKSNGTVILESEVKEITKIVKIENEDGTIVIQKKEIKIEREIKGPVRGQNALLSQSSSANSSSNMSNQSSKSSKKSYPYSNSKTIGVISIKQAEVNDKLTIDMKVKSELLTPFPPMSDPIERFCMSSVTLLSSNLDCNFTNCSCNDFKECISLKSSDSHSEQFLSNFESNQSVITAEKSTSYDIE